MILGRDREPEVALQQALGVAMSADEYWAAVGENLARGRIRGFIVADEIPAELRRIIEYLNDQLGDSRFLALEVPQFKAADGVTTRPPDRGWFAGAAGQTSELTSQRSVGRRPDHCRDRGEG